MKTKTKQFKADISFNDDLVKTYGWEFLNAFTKNVLNRGFAKLSSKRNIKDFIYCNREAYDYQDYLDVGKKKVIERRSYVR